MSIVYRTGNVVEALKNGDINVLVHGVNCQGKMNSGIAKEIRAEFPVVFDQYKKYIDLNMKFTDNDGNYSLEDLLGDIQIVNLDTPINKITKYMYVVNAFTQNNYGYSGDKFVSYDAINEVMWKLIANFPEDKIIGMPKIGAGLGGGDWKVIEAIINSAFVDREVYVYTLEEKKTDGRNDLG